MSVTLFISEHFPFAVQLIAKVTLLSFFSFFKITRCAGGLGEKYEGVEKSAQESRGC